MQPPSSFDCWSSSVRACCMQLAYSESADTNLGPFNVEARLTSVGGAVLYATGTGKVTLRFSMLCISCCNEMSSF